MFRGEMSPYQQSVQLAQVLAASYVSATELLGDSFEAAPAELREHIEKVAAEGAMSALAAGGVVIAHLRAAGKLEPSTLMMIRASVFALYAARKQTGFSAGSKRLRGIPTEN